MKESIKGMNKFFTEIKETFEITKETIIKYKKMNKNALQRYKNVIKYVQKILESIFI